MGKLIGFLWAFASSKMKLLVAFGLTAALLLAGCATSGLTEEDLVTLRADIRNSYEERADVVQEVFLGLIDGKASGYVKWYAAGETFSHDCTVTVYDDGQITWRCGP